MQDRLIFLISPPRSGSTLLQRMLGSHSGIMTHPEPHLITPMAYLGFYETVDKAPYDHINSAEAIRLFVQGLPRGEEDYLDALRAYADVLYGRMLGTTSKAMFLDKTPAYGLVLPFLTKLYPKAKYVVLTRHPFAIFSSYANSFFDGNWGTAHDFNPILERYVPAMARLLRENQVPLIHVRYEELVREPARQLESIFSFLGLPHEPQAVEYGKHFTAKKGPGDPISVNQHDRPVSDSVSKWANELAADPTKKALAERIARGIDAKDLAEWGWSHESLWDGIEGARGQHLSTAASNPFMLQRRIFLALKKDIHHRPHGKWVKRVRYYCDVLLRE